MWYGWAVREGWVVRTRLYIQTHQNEKQTLQLQILRVGLQNVMHVQKVQWFA